MVYFRKTKHFVILLRPANDTEEGKLFEIICPITQCAKIYGDVQMNGNAGKDIPLFPFSEIIKENKKWKGFQSFSATGVVRSCNIFGKGFDGCGGHSALMSRLAKYSET